MSYIGNSPYQVAFVTDTFNGNGSTTAFTMSVAPANTASVLVVVSGVVQDPSTYSVSGTTLTFTAAPPSGTGNISCRYLGIPASGVTTTAYRTVTEFTATAGQTTFTPPSYTVGFINVYRNGSRLGTADYTASNGTTVVLTSAASASDLVTVESFLVSSVLNAIPATAGSVGSTYLASSLSLTTPTLTSPVTAGTPTGVGVLTSGTSQASTSGTSIDFTSIPSWVKRITVMFSAISTNSTSPIQIQLGAGSVTTSGYATCTWTANTNNTNYSSGFILRTTATVAAGLFSGHAVFTTLGSNNWVGTGITARTEAADMSVFGGNITLSGTLDRVRITTVNGTDTFDAGSINILYE